MAAVDRRLYQPPNHELRWTLGQPFLPLPFNIFEPLKRKNNEEIMPDWTLHGALQQGAHLGHLDALTEARRCVCGQPAPSAGKGHWLPRTVCLMDWQTVEFAYYLRLPRPTESKKFRLFFAPVCSYWFAKQREQPWKIRKNRNLNKVNPIS